MCWRPGPGKPPPSWLTSTCIKRASPLLAISLALPWASSHLNVPISQMWGNQAQRGSSACPHLVQPLVNQACAHLAVHPQATCSPSLGLCVSKGSEDAQAFRAWLPGRKQGDNGSPASQWGLSSLSPPRLSQGLEGLQASQGADLGWLPLPSVPIPRSPCQAGEIPAPTW